MSVLLVGNGVNQCADIAPKWEQLFEDAVKVKGFQVAHSLTPTLEYEMNVQRIQALNPRKTPSAIKRDIAKHLKEKQQEAPKGWAEIIHKPLLAAAPETILTTNYDYFLELAVKPQFQPGPASTKRRNYSLDRYREVPGHRIFHIHGELSGPASICLGLDQYTNSIKEICGTLTASTGKNESGSKTRFHLYDVLTKQTEPQPNHWYYNFFTEDVYILGFGLDAAEQDIWWLLNHRAALMQKHPGLIQNTITYFEVSAPGDSESKAARDKALRACTGRGNITEKEKALEAFGQEYAKAHAKATQLEQKKAQLEAFRVQVVDCTTPEDIPNATKNGKIDFAQVYRTRYLRAVEALEKTKEKALV